MILPQITYSQLYVTETQSSTIIYIIIDITSNYVLPTIRHWTQSSSTKLVKTQDTYPKYEIDNKITQLFCRCYFYLMDLTKLVSKKINGKTKVEVRQRRKMVAPWQPALVTGGTRSIGFVQFSIINLISHL